MKVYQNLLLMGLGIIVCYSCTASQLFIVPDPYLSEGLKNWLQELFAEQQTSHSSVKSTFETVKKELPSTQELHWTQEPDLPAIVRLVHARPILLIHRLNNTDIVLTKSGDYTPPACYKKEILERLPSMIIEETSLETKEETLLAAWACSRPPLFFNEYTCRWINKNYIALNMPQSPGISIAILPQKPFSTTVQDQLQQLYSEFSNANNQEFVIDTRFKNWVISKRAIKKGLQ